MGSAKFISSQPEGPVPLVDLKVIAAPEIALSERVSGALLCSIDATIWMLLAGLVFVIWSIKLTLMVGFAVLSNALRGRR